MKDTKLSLMKESLQKLSINIILTLLKKAVEKNQEISPTVTKIKIKIKTMREIVKSYGNHPSILQIKQNISSSSFHVKENFRFHFVNEIEIKKLIQGLNSKKLLE